MIGPGKAFDTEHYFIICSNVLGGCKGSTGPASINPITGRPYGLQFPVITIKDMVNAQRHLIDYLGIDKLLAVVGGSMGGMQALQWVVSYPDRVRSVIPVATTANHSPQQIAFNEVGRQAIMADPNWNEGDYYGKELPAKGLSVARMVGHITYMSDVSMSEKFGRKFKNTKQPFKFSPEFEVEGYLQYRGDNFIKRFDPNSYLYITKAIDYFDLANGTGLREVFKGIAAPFLIIAFKSDWLYPAYQSQEIARACKLAGIDAIYCELNSNYGHDAFLVEVDEQAHLIKYFLQRVAGKLKVIDEHNV
jgi:homoserine O-acetyltransferase